MRKVARWISVISIFVLVSASHGQEDIGDVRGTGQGPRVTPISLKSSDGEVLALVTRAFSSHGAYSVERGSSGSFQFEFNPVGSAIVELRISSGSKELVRRRFEGRDLSEATLAAADYAVQRTTGLRGYFSGMVAFISNQTGKSELYVGDLFLSPSRTRRLTLDRAQCMLPNLSPDGNVLLYTSYKSGFPDIYRVDLLSGKVTAFASYRGMNSGASFSPNGDRVAMVLGKGNTEIYIGDPQGQRLQQLTRTKALEADPSWSPDGRRLVFTSGNAGRPQIYMMSADGSGLSRIPTNISGNCSEPDWNPVDPDSFVFTAVVGKEFELCLYSFKERKSTILTQGRGDCVEAQWLNDGRHLIFTERTSKTSRLAILDSKNPGKRTYLTAPQAGRCSMASYVYPLGR